MTRRYNSLSWPINRSNGLFSNPGLLQKAGERLPENHNGILHLTIGGYGNRSNLRAMKMIYVIDRCPFAGQDPIPLVFTAE